MSSDPYLSHANYHAMDAEFVRLTESDFGLRDDLCRLVQLATDERASYDEAVRMLQVAGARLREYRQYHEFLSNAAYWYINGVGCAIDELLECANTQDMLMHLRDLYSGVLYEHEPVGASMIAPKTKYTARDDYQEYRTASNFGKNTYWLFEDDLFTRCPCVSCGEKRDAFLAQEERFAYVRNAMREHMRKVIDRRRLDAFGGVIISDAEAVRLRAILRE